MNILIKLGAGILGAALTTSIGNKIYSEHHYGEDGYNANGYDREGYDREGYDCEGYDREGYNREGYNREGFNRAGFDVDGYDKTGYNVQGFNRRGFDREGYDKDGYDARGFNRKGYNVFGIDRSGYNSDHYHSSVSEIRNLAEKAHREMKKGELAYAFRDIRVGAEIALKEVLRHSGKTVKDRESLNSMIRRCKSAKLFPEEMCNKLNELRIQCNDSQHDTRVEKQYNQAHFCYMTLLESARYLEEVTQ